MVKKTYTIRNPNGLDCVASALIVSVSNKFKSNISVSYKNLKADAKSLFSLMRLEAGKGSSVTVIVSGIDEEQAIDKLEWAFSLELEDEIKNASVNEYDADEDSTKW